MAKNLYRFIGIVFTILSLLGCKEQDAPAFWPLDVDNGYRFFIGVCDYSYEKDNPEVSVQYRPSGSIQEWQQLEMTDYGVTVAGKLYYYYDISEDWFGKTVDISIVYSVTGEQYYTVVSLENERNLWFKVEDGAIHQIKAPVSEDNP